MLLAMTISQYSNKVKWILNKTQKRYSMTLYPSVILNVFERWSYIW